MELDRSSSDEELRWYVDGEQFHSVKESQVGADVWKNATDHGFFLILNVAVGGGWPGSPTEATASGKPMVVDYVKVLQKGTSEDDGETTDPVETAEPVETTTSPAAPTTPADDQGDDEGDGTDASPIATGTPSAPSRRRASTARAVSRQRLPAAAASWATSRTATRRSTGA